MRILHILNHSKKLSGNVHAAVDLACAQSALGHKVYLCSGGGDFDSVLKSCAVEVIVLSQDRSFKSILNAVVTLRNLCLSQKIEVVHAHMMTSAIIAWAATFFTPSVLITTAHNAFQRASVLMGLGKRVIAVSSATKEVMIKRGVSSSRISVILNGTIGSPRLQQLELNHRDLEPNSIMYIGGLHPRKGLPDLLAAYELIYKKNVTPKLYIVGEGPYSKSYRDLAASLKSSENIIFLGRTESPLSVLAFADVFVLPSHADPAPLVISEAREARCAVIATRIDGIPELLEEGEAGILVQAGNVTEIAQAIAMLTNNKKNMEQWKLRSQINIDRLSVERVALQTIMVYNEVIGKGASDC